MIVSVCSDYHLIEFDYIDVLNIHIVLPNLKYETLHVFLWQILWASSSHVSCRDFLVLLPLKYGGYVFVAGISFSSTEETLTQAFSQYGRVLGGQSINLNNNLLFTYIFFFGLLHRFCLLQWMWWRTKSDADQKVLLMSHSLPKKKPTKLYYNLTDRYFPSC